MKNMITKYTNLIKKQIQLLTKRKKTKPNTTKNILILLIIIMGTILSLLLLSIMRGPENISPLTQTISLPILERLHIPRREMKKQFQLIGLKIPAYTTGQLLKSIQLDVTLHTSNRYLVQYIDKHEYAIKDSIYTKIQPIDPEFARTPEGKRVLKEKIKAELDRHFKKVNIKGNIEDVTIDGMIES